MTKNQKTLVSLPRSYREAILRPTTINEAERTVEVVWATTAPVLRYGLEGEGYYYEELSLAPESVVLDRFSKGLPLLDSHNRDSAAHILGKVTDPAFPVDANGMHTESRCKATFSANNPKADPIFKDVRDGIISGWSFGYDVLRLEKTERFIDGLRVYVGTLWEPHEVSVTPVPADPAAGARNQTISRNCEIVSIRGKDMKRKNGQRSEEQNPDDEDDDTTETSDAGDNDTEKKKGGKKEQGGDPDERTKTDNAAAEKRAVIAERARIREIRSAVDALPGVLDAEKVEDFIESGASADDVRRELVDAARQKQPVIKSGAGIDFGADAGDKKREAMVTALLSRAAPAKHVIKDGDDARQFRGMNLLDMAKECLGDAGVSFRGMTPKEVASRAFGLKPGEQRDIATGDFPLLLSNAVNKSLRAAYIEAPQTFQAYSARASAKDFKEMHLIQVGDISAFQKVAEGGEYRRGKFGEAKESYRVEKYGQIISITWESIINDDLQAFSRIPNLIANEARQLEGDIVYDILLKNPRMGDGKPLFCADHGNLGAASAINFTGMDAAFVAMGEQKSGEKSKRPLNLRPEFLLVGSHKQSEAGQYLQATVPAKQEDAVPGYMKQLTAIWEARIPGKNWFLVCSPSRIDTIEYAYLEGEEGLFTEERDGFDVDGLEIKARLVFGAKAVDWRGMYMNPGA